MSINDSLIESLIIEIRNFLKENGEEYQLTSNDYGFKVAWLEDEEVYWEYDQDLRPFRMGELTELAALLETLQKTRLEIEEEFNK